MGKTSSEVKNRWNAKNYDRIGVMAPKGEKAEFQAAAEAQGQSVNAYILEAVRRRMESERNNPEITDSDSHAAEIQTAHPTENQDEIEVPAFLLYRSAAYLLCLMDDKNAGGVIKAASAYFLRGETPEASFQGIMKDTFNNIRSGIDRDTAKYRRNAERNREINRNRSNQRNVKEPTQSP